MQLLTTTSDSRAKDVGNAKRVARWIRDRFWATLDPPAEDLSGDPEQPRCEISPNTDYDVLREVYARLTAELENEGERRRAVESKLLSIASGAPIAVSIMVAAASFLSSGRLPDFASGSVIAISFVALYVALQFLRALLAATRGVTRRSYATTSVSEIMPADTEGRNAYLCNASQGLARRIVQHREATNGMVSQLAVAHESIKNAVFGLVVELFILSGVIVWESLT